MLGIGGTELAIIGLFAFLVFGPDKLPQMGRTLGRALRQFRSAQEEVNRVIRQEVYDPSKDQEALGEIKNLFTDLKNEVDPSKLLDPKAGKAKAYQDSKQETSSKLETSPKQETSSKLEGTVESSATKDSTDKERGLQESQVPSLQAELFEFKKQEIKEDRSKDAQEPVKQESFAEKKARLAKERVQRDLQAVDTSKAVQSPQDSVQEDSSQEDHELSLAQQRLTKLYNLDDKEV